MTTPTTKPPAVTVQEYLDTAGRSAYGAFFDALPALAAVKVTTAVERLAQGHSSGLKPLKGGLAEWKIDWGPGLRIYVHQDGATLILLMGGSNGKKAQGADIQAATALVKEYKERKKAAAKAAKARSPGGAKKKR